MKRNLKGKEKIDVAIPYFLVLMWFVMNRLYLLKMS